MSACPVTPNRRPSCSSVSLHSSLMSLHLCALLISRTDSDTADPQGTTAVDLWTPDADGDWWVCWGECNSPSSCHWWPPLLHRQGTSLWAREAQQSFTIGGRHTGSRPRMLRKATSPSSMSGCSEAIDHPPPRSVGRAEQKAMKAEWEAMPMVSHPPGVVPNSLITITTRAHRRRSDVLYDVLYGPKSRSEMGCFGTPGMAGAELTVHVAVYSTRAHCCILSRQFSGW